MQNQRLLYGLRKQHVVELLRPGGVDAEQQALGTRCHLHALPDATDSALSMLARTNPPSTTAAEPETDGSPVDHPC